MFRSPGDLANADPARVSLGCGPRVCVSPCSLLLPGHAWRSGALKDESGHKETKLEKLARSHQVGPVLRTEEKAQQEGGCAARAQRCGGSDSKKHTVSASPCDRPVSVVRGRAGPGAARSQATGVSGTGLFRSGASLARMGEGGVSCSLVGSRGCE